MFLISGFSLVTLYCFRISIRIFWWITYGVLLWCFLTGILMFYWLMRCIAAKESKHLIDLLDQKNAFLSLTAVLNILSFFYYFYIWLRYRSFWFGSMTVFYITLSFGRGLLVWETRYGASRISSQWKKYIFCGYMVLVMTLILFVQTILITQQGYRVMYPGKTIWIVFIFTIYLTYYAIQGWISFKKWNCPLLQADRSLAFCACLLSLYSLMVGFSDSISKVVRNLVLLDLFVGSAAIITLAVIAVYMIVHGSQKLETVDPHTWIS